MNKFFNNLIAILAVVIKFLFSSETIVTILFLAGIVVVLYTVFSISTIVFGFTLGAVLIGLALLINYITTPR